MLKIHKLNITHLYIPIALILIGLVLLFSGQTKLQIELVSIGALIYLGLAFAHHHFDKSLTIEVVLEYILIAVLSLIILQQFLI